MPKNHPHKSGAHSAAASKSPKRRPSTKSSEASLATSSEEHSEEAERRPSHPAPERHQQPQQERKPQHQQQQQPQQERQPQHQKQPQQERQPQQPQQQPQPQQVQQVPMFYQAHTPMLPMQGGMQGQVFVDPNDPNTLHYEGFDPGARFSNLAPPRVPPPPPGVMPNPAQLALMQGHNVVVTQRKANVISGGSSGGVDTSCTLQ